LAGTKEPQGIHAMDAPQDTARPIETRRLAAIMFTDIVGFSRQMGVDETRLPWLLDIRHQTITQIVNTSPTDGA
jgi:class 3 adenylate cyclase